MTTPLYWHTRMALMDTLSQNTKSYTPKQSPPGTKQICLASVITALGLNHLHAHFICGLAITYFPRLNLSNFV